MQVELFISFRLKFDSVSDSEFEESEDHVSAIEFMTMILIYLLFHVWIMAIQFI